MRQADIVEALPAGGAWVDTPLPGGVTPLMVACALALNALVKRLLVWRVRLAAVDDQAHAQLHYVAEFLLQCSDSLNAHPRHTPLPQLVSPALTVTEDGL